MSEELKPCPFCGGEAEIGQRGDRRQSTIYACTECGCRLETGEEWGFGRNWNTRAETPQSIPSEREEIVALASIRVMCTLAIQELETWPKPTVDAAFMAKQFHALADLAEEALSREHLTRQALEQGSDDVRSD